MVGRKECQYRVREIAESALGRERNLAKEEKERKKEKYVSWKKYGFFWFVPDRISVIRQAVG